MKINGINNVDVDHDRYVVARYDRKTHELWFYGSWDNLESAERVAMTFDNSVVVDMEDYDGKGRM